MIFPRLYIVLLLSAWVAVAHAEEKKYHIGGVVDFGENGWNKVLCMKNGNTMLFHFELNKAILVKVFDTGYRQIGSREFICDVVDITKLGTALFKGIYEVNGEAVLFIEQENSGRHSLVRLRFSGKDGKAIDETVVGKSKSMAKPMHFYVMKSKSEDNYAILFSTDIPQFRNCELHVSFYNQRHEVVKEVPLTVDRKKYDYLEVVGAESQPNGICITLGLSKLELNGTGRTMESANIYEHYVGMYYIPKDSVTAKSRVADVSTDIFPYCSKYAYNPFAKTLNLLVLSYRDALQRYGLEMRPSAIVANLFFKLDEENFDMEHNWITNKMANDYLKGKTDTINSFQGLPINIFTNDNGLSTMVSQSFYRYNNVESRARANVYETYLGNICITQFDDNGNEIWGTVLPRIQYHKSYRHYLNPREITHKWQEQLMFGDLPPQIYNRQFASLNAYTSNNNLYIVYNDLGKNYRNTIDRPGDTVFSFDVTNACYYKMDRKKEVTKHYLYGEPLVREYKSSLIEGADFDEQRGVYASLIQYKRGEYVSIRMAWAHLE